MTSLKNITSRNNPLIKTVLALREKRERDRLDLMLIEGVTEVRRAWQAGIPMTQAVVCREILKKFSSLEILGEFQKNGIPLAETSAEIFEKISFGDRQEGLLAIAARPKTELRDLSLSSNPFLVVMEAVEKPGNLGAVLRSCDGAGVEAVIVCEPKLDIYNPNCIRASVGAFFHLKVVRAGREETYAFLKEKKLRIFAASPHAKKNYAAAYWKGPSALIVGSEHAGLSDFWFKRSFETLKIPMRGVGDSLNLSVSAGIMIYEALRQRSSKT